MLKSMAPVRDINLRNLYGGINREKQRTLYAQRNKQLEGGTQPHDEAKTGISKLGLIEQLHVLLN